MAYSFTVELDLINISNCYQASFFANKTKTHKGRITRGSWDGVTILHSLLSFTAACY